MTDGHFTLCLADVVSGRFQVHMIVEIKLLVPSSNVSWSQSKMDSPSSDTGHLISSTPGSVVRWGSIIPSAEGPRYE